MATRADAPRDREDAFVSVNGQTCWRKTDILGTVGTQLCGGVFKEERFRATGCFVVLSGLQVQMPLTVRVWTSLDGDATDESFGIDNVVIEHFTRADPPVYSTATPCQSKAEGEFLGQRK